MNRQSSQPKSDISLAAAARLVVKAFRNHLKEKKLLDAYKTAQRKTKRGKETLFFCPLQESGHVLITVNEVMTSVTLCKRDLPIEYFDEIKDFSYFFNGRSCPFGRSVVELQSRDGNLGSFSVLCAFPTALLAEARTFDYTEFMMTLVCHNADSIFQALDEIAKGARANDVFLKHHFPVICQ